MYCADEIIKLEFIKDLEPVSAKEAELIYGLGQGAVSRLWLSGKYPWAKVRVGIDSAGNLWAWLALFDKPDYVESGHIYKYVGNKPRKDALWDFYDVEMH